MTNPILIVIGVCSVGSGTFQIRKAFRDGTFYGKGGIAYHEDRRSFFFWLHLLLIIALILGGGWLTWLGLL